MFKYGLLRGYLEPKKNISVLGIYEKQEIFAGTDKLSMAVQSDFEKYVSKIEKNIIFEGDRLFTKKNLISLVNSHETRIILLENDVQTLSMRHKERKDNQSSKFLKSRETKLMNIVESPYLKNKIEKHNLTEINETEKLAELLQDWIIN